MTAISNTKPQRAVPAYLVYEVMDGQPIYYRDYKKIIRHTLKKEDIISSSIGATILMP